ncbi:MAG: DUF2791 family P-loop domain-containing protein [Chloroflexi bacterium]|nr:DUF2791 family P-loop domain-containing protein [Chloroflexota bacterium]
MPDNALGMLVSGDFGTGKSHLLTYLEHLALERGFVCSKVVISKETPLYDLSKVFKSAVDNGRMPDRKGRLIEELGQALAPRSEAYDALYVWAHDTPANGLSQIFPASLRVHSDSRDLQLDSEVERFWGGDPILVSRVKGGLRQIRQLQSYSFRAPRVAELPPQRLRFTTELIKAAGYKGWVVLLDEIELVGSYSLLQRGRSYAELARWMGQAVTQKYPGLIVVGTVTADFATTVIDPSGQKRDRDNVGPRLQARHEDIVPLAEAGMRLLERGGIPLSPPPDSHVQSTMDELRRIYSIAYDWNAPPLLAKSGGAGYQGRMRFKVRSAINEWDLIRVYPNSRPDIVGDDFRSSYTEDHDLETESKDNAGDDC